jgi:large subunit ribosomal protein L10
MAHVATWKHGEVAELTSLLSSHKIVGIADISGIPGPQLQKMRGGLRKNAVIRASKNTLIMKALDEAEKNVKGINTLKSEVKGQAAVIATDVNPFALFREIKATRTDAPAKGGETATHDIEVKAGDTPFKPGPIVGELQKVGIPAAIQEGKVIIKNDKVIVEQGQKIPVDVAQMLSRLGINPIELGLKLNAAFENGMLYKPEVLDIDMERFMGDLRTAHLNAFTLAMETAWTNNATIRHLVMKAYRSAHGLAVERTILTKDTLPQLLARAQRSMQAVSSHVKQPSTDEKPST